MTKFEREEVESLFPSGFGEACDILRISHGTCAFREREVEGDAEAEDLRPAPRAARDFGVRARGEEAVGSYEGSTLSIYAFEVEGVRKHDLEDLLHVY